MARPRAPDSSSTSTSTVGLPRESRTSRPTMCSMLDMVRRRCSWQGDLRRLSVAAVEGVANVTRVADGGRVSTRAVPLNALSVRVGRDIVHRLGTAGETFALQVREPSDLKAAIGAL